MTAQKIQPKSADPLRGEADLFAAGFELQHQGLELLLAGEGPRLPSDAEVEAGFDNMPI